MNKKQVFIVCYECLYVQTKVRNNNIKVYDIRHKADVTSTVG